MKNTLKGMMPYVIINGIVFSIIGAIIGKNIVEIHNTRRRINNDSRALNKYLYELTKSCKNTMTLDEFEKMGNDEDPKKPIEPTKIYVYN